MKTDHWFYGLFQSAPDLKAVNHRLDDAFRTQS